jgi:hypothetical protein
MNRLGCNCSSAAKQFCLLCGSFHHDEHASFCGKELMRSLPSSASNDAVSLDKAAAVQSIQITLQEYVQNEMSIKTQYDGQLLLA